MIDLVLSPIYLEAGQERKELPGLYAAPPRKSSRLRANDRAILFLAHSGSEILPHNVQQELLTRLAETYYTSAGSVTFGMKATADRLNDFLINRNLRQSRQQGGQAIGIFNMVVMHGDSLYIGQAGPTHTYLIAGEQVEHFTDASGVGRSLGLAKLVSLRFFQTTFEPGACLLLSSTAAPGWNDAALIASSSLKSQAMRQQLQSGLIDLQACFVRTAPGKGLVHWEYSSSANTGSDPLRPAVPTPATPAPSTSRADPLTPQWLPDMAAPNLPVQPTAPGSAKKPEEAVQQSSMRAAETPVQGVYLTGKPLSEARPDIPPWEEAAALPAVPSGPAPVDPAVTITQPVEVSRPGRGSRTRPAQAESGQSGSDIPVKISTAPGGEPTISPHVPDRKNVFRPSPAAAGLARFFAGVIAGIRGFGKGLNRLAARALPDQPADGVQMTPSTMLFIALAVPVVVVAVAATIYTQRGRGEMQAAALQTARQFATQANGRDDPLLKIKDWGQALSWLDKADSYGGSAEAAQLRSQVQGGLDGLQGVARVAYRPAMSAPLAEGIQIARMVTNVNDIYILDSNQGRILRIYRSGQASYDLDPSFACGPGKYVNIIVGKLIDIAPLPPNNIAKAAVMGMDANGNVLYCGPNNPASVYQLEGPDMNWSKPTRLVYFQDILYVLDGQANQVYRYLVTDGKFTGKPRLYFDDRVPHLSDVIDIGVDQEILYLLHADGSMTTCNNTGIKTTCEDPAVYGDSRVGRDPAPLKFPTASFSLMQVSQPPDPSLYVLDTKADSIYHFSLRKLNMQRMYRPEVQADYPPFDRQPSAFVVTASRRVVLAVDNQLYIATLP